ncbi:MAG TPA: DUF805 domain-containing protein [Patescibacteria group bacterium]|nr:DUF805 domain-containing protein [Patescibacteria group bacterium]
MNENNQIPPVSPTPMPTQTTPPPILQQSTPYLIRFFYIRLNRRNYFLGINTPYLFLLALSFTNITNSMPQGISLFIGLTLLIIITIYGISLNIRRLHDINKSGLWMLGLFVPVLNIIVMIMLYFWPGTKGNNAYGKPPVARISIKDIL